jgi:hypothetical protein
MKQLALAFMLAAAVCGASGGRGGSGGGGGGQGGSQAGVVRIPGHMTAELRAILPRKLTVMQIRDVISGEFEPVPIADVMAYFDAQAKLGSVKLTEKAPEALPKARKK